MLLEVAKNIFQFMEETKPWFLFDPDAEARGIQNPPLSAFASVR